MVRGTVVGSRLGSPDCFTVFSLQKHTGQGQSLNTIAVLLIGGYQRELFSVVRILETPT